MPLRTDIATILTTQAPLFALARRGVAEVVVSGASFYKAEGGKVQGSDPTVVLVARSLLKPWQFLAADVAGTDKFWALGLASHSGQPHHMEELRHLAAVAGAGDDELVCPRGYPLDPGVASVMKSAGVQPSRLHHPCAGKHLVALAACRAQGHPLERYWDSEHPIQKRVAALIGQSVGERPLWMTDSCGLPTIAASAKAIINMWEKLALADDPKAKALKALWTGNPRLVGGNGRLDSDLMEVAPGRILAKEGADGLLVVVALPENGHPAATCLVKLASGYSGTYLALALWALLATVQEPPPALGEIKGYLRSRLEKWVPGDQELELPPFA